MPFTASHVAAALPFLRWPLPPAALVIGSMVPDLPYYLPLPPLLDVPRAWTHALPGVPTIDLAMGAVLFAAWWAFLREPVIDLLPVPIRRRIPSRRPGAWRPATWSRARGILALVAALVIGILTHVLWDAFTHPGPVVDAVPGLNTRLGPLVAHKWLQHGSSVVGALALVIWSWRWMRRTPAVLVRPVVVPPAFRVACWVALIVVAVGAGLATWLVGISHGVPALDPRLVFRVAGVMGGSVLAVVLLAAIGWHVARRARGDVKGTPSRAG